MSHCEFIVYASIVITYIVHFIDILYDNLVVALDSYRHIVGHGLILIHHPLGLDQGVYSPFLLLGIE